MNDRSHVKDDVRSVLSSNISKLRKKKDSLTDVESLVYHDMASLYMSEHSGKVSAESAREFYVSLTDENELVNTAFASFCREIIKMSCAVILPRSDDDAEPDVNAARISYIKNPLSDKAYSRFSNVLPNSSASYFTSFREVCEEVFYNRSKYAILPVYSSSEGMLSSFRKLITKYDMKIAYMTDIETEDDGYTRFSLLRRGLSVTDDGQRQLYITVTLSSSGSFDSLVSSLTALGAAIKAVNSVSEYYGGDLSFDFELDAREPVISGVILFLECTRVRYSVIGKITLV